MASRSRRLQTRLFAAAAAVITPALALAGEGEPATAADPLAQFAPGGDLYFSTVPPIPADPTPDTASTTPGPDGEKRVTPIPLPTPLIAGAAGLVAAAIAARRRRR